MKRIRNRDEEGFTLIEVLVVISILGILAGIVVFAVGGLGDRGQAKACATDKKTIQTAQEAYFAQGAASPPAYAASVGALVSANFLSSASLWYQTTGSGVVTAITNNPGSCT